jgi:hypothetical protein
MFCRPLALDPLQPYSSLDTIDKVRKADDPPGPGKVQGSAQTCMTREVTMMVVAKDGNCPSACPVKVAFNALKRWITSWISRSATRYTLLE